MFVVYADMVGDLFHGGHVNFLRQARELAVARLAARDGIEPSEAAKHVRLVVGLLADDVAVAYKRRPVLTLAERVAVVSACRYVDDIVTGCPLAADDRFLDEHGFDLVVHGDDYTDEELQRYYAVPMQRGIFATVPYTRQVGDIALSTTDILDRIRTRGAPGGA